MKCSHAKLLMRMRRRALAKPWLLASLTVAAVSACGFTGPIDIASGRQASVRSVEAPVASPATHSFESAGDPAASQVGPRGGVGSGDSRAAPLSRRAVGGIRRDDRKVPLARHATAAAAEEAPLDPASARIADSVSRGEPVQATVRSDPATGTFAGAAAVAGVPVIASGAKAGWHAWLWVLAATVLFLGVAGALRARRRARQMPEDRPASLGWAGWKPVSALAEKSGQPPLHGGAASPVVVTDVRSQALRVAAPADRRRIGAAGIAPAPLRPGHYGGFKRWAVARYRVAVGVAPPRQRDLPTTVPVFPCLEIDQAHGDEVTVQLEHHPVPERGTPPSAEAHRPDMDTFEASALHVDTMPRCDSGDEFPSAYEPVVDIVLPAPGSTESATQVSVSGVSPEREGNAARATAESLHVSLARASLALSKGDAEQAIFALRPHMTLSSMSGGAWTVAGWAWWSIARRRGPDALEVADLVVAAFERAIDMEPERARLLERAVAKLHLFRATLVEDDQRCDALDSALAALGRAMRVREKADDGLRITLAGTLYERAMLVPEGRKALLTQAAEVMDVLVVPAHCAEQWTWLHAHVLIALAGVSDLHAATRWETMACNILWNYFPSLDAGRHEEWLCRIIETERAFAARLQGAARITHLTGVKRRLHAAVECSTTIHPLLAWINLVHDWSKSLTGTSARSKLAEVDTLFECIRQLSPHEQGAIAFAQAYYLRLRAQQELPARHLSMLKEAEGLLDVAVSPAAGPDMIALERAEISLARGHLLDGREARDAFERAAAFADGVMDTNPGNAVMAATCALRAHLALAATANGAPRMRRLNELSAHLRGLKGDAGDTLQYAAQVALLDNAPQRAAELCHAAWCAGTNAKELLPCWKQALLLWEHELKNTGGDPSWERQHRYMRLASSN